MSRYYFIPFILLLFSCAEQQPKETQKEKVSQEDVTNTNTTSLLILGTIQDAGQPHIGCDKQCCNDLFNDPDKTKQVVSLGLYDMTTGNKYLFEAAPDMPSQMKRLKNFGESSENELADGIFLTHAHIGHYSGLIYLGKEAKDAKNTPVYVMPRMKTFLQNNGPWSQLVTQKNIVLNELENEVGVPLSDNLVVTPILVPHRDEYSETVGYKIEGPNKSALFIPDIDKWEKWGKNIIDEIRKVDYAFLDATFYSGEELNNRDIRQIPHPFITESLEEFNPLSQHDRSKVVFIHFNHTNPVSDSKSEEAKYVIEQGYRIAEIDDVFEL